MSSKYRTTKTHHYSKGDIFAITVKHDDWNEAIPIGSLHTVDRVLERLQLEEKRADESSERILELEQNTRNLEAERDAKPRHDFRIIPATTGKCCIWDDENKNYLADETITPLSRTSTVAYALKFDTVEKAVQYIKKLNAQS